MGVDVGFRKLPEGHGFIPREETTTGCGDRGAKFSPRDPAFGRAPVAAHYGAAPRGGFRIARLCPAHRGRRETPGDPKVSCALRSDGIWSRRREALRWVGAELRPGRTVFWKACRSVTGSSRGAIRQCVGLRVLLDPPVRVRERRRRVHAAATSPAWPDPWRVPPAVGSPRPDGRWRT